MEKKIIDKIKKFGIQKYKKSWKPKLTDSIDDIVKSYHPHSFIIKKIDDKSDSSNNKIKNRLPKTYVKNETLVIKFFSYIQTTKKEEEKHINRVRKHVRKGNYKNIIIDLSEHRGGDMWIAILGLIDIFGNTTLCCFTDKKVNKDYKKWINIKNEDFKFGRYKTKDLKFKGKIAVIIDKATESSGEIIAGCFVGRENVKLFGSQTAGYMSINQSFIIDDHILNLTVLLFEDVNQKLYTEEYIVPDIKTKYPLKDALRWCEN